MAVATCALPGSLSMPRVRDKAKAVAITMVATPVPRRIFVLLDDLETTPAAPASTSPSPCTM